jgi:opacity protein-like surface antigen
MIPNVLLSASLAALLVASTALPAAAQQTPQQQPNQQNEQSSKSASGKVTDIGKDKKSFSVQTNDQENNKRTIVFVINGDTQIKGQVTVGTDVEVEYRPSADGNVALVITPRSSGGGHQ